MTKETVVDARRPARAGGIPDDGLAADESAGDEVAKAVAEWAGGDATRVRELCARVTALPVDLHAIVLGCALALHDEPELPPRGLVSRWRGTGDAADAGLADELEDFLGGPPDPGWSPFPLEVLPDPLRRFARAAAAAIGCDPAMVATPVLAACASAIGRSRWIELKPGWKEPSIVWGAIIGPSGSLKSPAISAALAPVESRQDQLAAEDAEADRLYRIDLAQHEKRLAQWRRRPDAGPPPEAPRAPRVRRVLAMDATVESMGPLLADNPKGFLLARDELAGWLGSFDRYARGQSDAPAWLEFHRGGLVLLDRKTSDRRTIRARGAVSLIGGIQAGTFRRLLGQKHMENGLLARFLVTMPPNRARRWTEETLPEDVVRGYEEVLRALWGLEMPEDANCSPAGVPAGIDPREAADGRSGGARPVSRAAGLDPGDLDDDPASRGAGEPPRPPAAPSGGCGLVLCLAPEALDRFKAFVNEHGAEQAGLDERLGATWSKLEGYAPRLALVIQLVRWADGEPGTSDRGPIDAASIEAGCRLARWYGTEARRVHAMLTECPEEARRRILVDWIRSREGGRVTARDVTRGPTIYRGVPEVAESDLRELARRGVGTIRYEHPPLGGRPTYVFELDAATGGGFLDEPPCQDGLPTRTLPVVGPPPDRPTAGRLPVGTPRAVRDETPDSSRNGEVSSRAPHRHPGRLFGAWAGPGPAIEDLGRLGVPLAPASSGQARPTSWTEAPSPADRPGGSGSCPVRGRVRSGRPPGPGPDASPAASPACPAAPAWADEPAEASGSEPEGRAGGLPSDSPRIDARSTRWHRASDGDPATAWPPAGARAQQVEPRPIREPGEEG